MGKKIGKALVLGAGISGIRSALDLAENGYGVTLVDHAPHMGGILSQLDTQFPSNHCGMCKMLPLVKREQSAQFCLRKGLFHENIDILLNTEVIDLEGEPGHFVVSLQQKPTWVDPKKCIGCGLCETVCPVDVPDAFNQGLTTHKAIYLPVPHTIPNPYVIDLAACNHCGECQKICPTRAISLSLENRKNYRILVVDDELIVRDSLKEWLDSEGFFVETADSGVMALETLSEGAFHLLLTDIKMPGMDGVELLQKVKESFPDLMVLMMTAFATVETAVDAMKIGAYDYMMKPFDPEKMVTAVVDIFERHEARDPLVVEVGAIVLSGGTDYVDPADAKDIYKYAENPNVITNLELERILSGTGPTHGRLTRPHDGKEIAKIAWIQCVGSRDLQCNADYCSSVCCMAAIKESLLVKEKSMAAVKTTIFYMDMRTYGKSFQRYRVRAEIEGGVRLERARIHSVTTDTTTGDPVIRYVQMDGNIENELFDLVVLSVGQRPAKGCEALSRLFDISLNPWGFIQTPPLVPVITDKSGVVVGGSFTGLKDIGESIVHASAASLEASRVIHTAGGSLADESDVEPSYPDVSREDPRILVAICACNDKYESMLDTGTLSDRLLQNVAVDQVLVLGQCCTISGWEPLREAIEQSNPNRILLGTCYPYFFIRKLKDLSQQIHLAPELIHVVDIMTLLMAAAAAASDSGRSATVQVLSELQMGISRLENSDPLPLAHVPVTRTALVVGGGIAGMHAALSIADHGYPVHLVERGEKLGGNLLWLDQTIDSTPLGPYLDNTVETILSHRLIDIHVQSCITASFGDVGTFYTTIETTDGDVQTIEHGTAIIATGGDETKTDAYHYGDHPAVISQKDLENRFKQNIFDVSSLNTVVMIQCVGSRQEPRNYCSRVCCPTSLKHALRLKQLKPDLNVYILYRDMMTIGFAESYFTKARRAGIIFIQYDPETPPQAVLPRETKSPLVISSKDPILSQPIEIETDLLVLATGISPHLPENLINLFGIEADQDGFFKEAESKWRPVDALKEGIFGCGIALSPRSIPDAIATAYAAAQRCLRILASDQLSTGKIVSSVRVSLCSLCERCVDTCPYHARQLDRDNNVIVVNPAKCQGCGECATVCPNSAAVIQGFNDIQMFGMIDAIIESTWQTGVKTH